MIENEIEEPHDIVLTVFTDHVAEEPFGKLTRQLAKQLAEVGIIKNN
jgi:hypothetical protein